MGGGDDMTCSRQFATLVMAMAMAMTKHRNLLMLQPSALELHSHQSCNGRMNRVKCRVTCRCMVHACVGAEGTLSSQASLPGGEVEGPHLYDAGGVVQV